MAAETGSQPLQPVPGNLSEGSLALQRTFQLISLNCSETQKLQLAHVFSQHPIDQILCWAKVYSSQSSTASSSSNRSSKHSEYSVASGSSYSSSLSIPSQSQSIPSGGLLPGISHQRSNCSYSQVSSVHSKEICIACNVSCTNKSVLTRHQKEHCEQEKEWQCRNCSPVKAFKRQEHLIQHHKKDHGPACVENCKKQQGLCRKHLGDALVDLPEKKAWGCPCCDNCFDSFNDWTIHSTHHQVENDKVVGYSLSTMVQSLLFKQPYLADAVASLHTQGYDWNSVDWTKVSDSTLQELREALERHKLPDAVQTDWEYRILQPPEALVQYAFFLGAYGKACLLDVPIMSNNASTVEERAEQTQIGMQNQTSNRQSPVGMPSQNFTPPVGYFNPENPLSYNPQGSPTTESDQVDSYLNQDGLHRSTATIHDASDHGRFMQHHDQNLHASFLPLPSEETQSLEVLGSSGSTSQDAGHDGERRRRTLSKKRSVKSFFKGLSSTKSNTSHMEPSLSTSAAPVDRILGSTWTASVPGHNRDVPCFEATETHQSSQHQTVTSNRLSHLPDAWEHAPEEQHYL